MISHVFLQICTIMCPKYEIVNLTNNWSSIDERTVKYAIVRCGELYQDAPCLKKVIKKEDGVYNIVCGNLIFGVSAQ